MPFIGNQPALSYTSFAKQDFTTSATTSYTLDHPVTNENEIALFINFVRQEPTTAYTASGTSLTLTSATSASDDMYCVFLGKAVQTVNPPSGSVGTSQIADLAVTSGKLASGVLPDNTPAFQAYASGSQSIPNNTETLVEYNIEDWDTDSVFNNTSSGNGYAFTVPSGEGGKYLFYMSVRKGPWTTSRMYIGLFKNGSNNGEFYAENGDGDWESVTPSVALNVSAGDYFQIKVYQDSGSTNSLNGGDRKILFGAYKLIGV